MPTHYEKLHVTENAPAEVIRAAYRALSHKHHPDKAGDRPLNRRRMQEINEAYAVLCDAALRRAYDESLCRERHPVHHHAVTPPARQTPHLRHRPARRMPGWLVKVFWFFSDSRIVIPLVVLLWTFVLMRAYRK